jgi:hypothetical protein
MIRETTELGAAHLAGLAAGVPISDIDRLLVNVRFLLQATSFIGVVVLVETTAPARLRRCPRDDWARHSGGTCVLGPLLFAQVPRPPCEDTLSSLFLSFLAVPPAVNAIESVLVTARRIPDGPSMEPIGTRESYEIISDRARSASHPLRSAERADVVGHHRYYGQSAYPWDARLHPDSGR